ncbi:MAG: beta-N-acetylhexosaminidase [Sedimentisphaerales bacterium]
MFNKLLIPPKKATIQKGFYRLTDKFDPAELEVRRDKTIKNAEGYKIKITALGVEIFANTDAGAFYACQTVRDLMKIYGGKLPLCKITDEPDFKRRGVYIDCSRGKVPTVKTIKQLVERLAHWKINELQLYIENVFTFKKHPEIGKGFSPFSPREILEIQNHCEKYHINFVGSLTSFGHFEKILALPKYQRLAELPGHRGFPAGATLDPTNPDSIKLVDDLYSEFMPLFQAEDFNVCCDETFELGQGRSKKLADKIGKGQVYLRFLLKIHQLCKKYKKRMNLWADIVLQHPELLCKLPKDIVLLNWEYEQTGENIAKTKTIAKTGIPFMVCPGTSSWQTHGSRLQNAMANIKNFAAQGRKHHAEGLLNTDWGDFGHRNFLGVSLHALAYGAAQSWNGKAVNDKNFTDIFCFHVFNQKTNQLSKALKLLGSSYIASGLVKNKCLLYHTLVAPVSSEKFLKIAKVAGLKKIVKQLSNKNLWPKTLSVEDEFERLAIEEFKLAAQMDVLAARRTLEAKGINAGFSINDMRKMANQFKKLWLARNKPSRLRDNLKLFDIE